jgi:hypothetical protein
LVLSIAARFPEVAENYRQRVVAVARGAVERIFAEAVRSGRIRPVDPAAAARAAIGPIIFEALWSHVLRGDTAFTDPERFLNQHLDILFRGLEQEPSA